MAAEQLAQQVGVAPACRALGVSRATFYRRKRPAPEHQQPRPTPARALCESERERVVEVLTLPRFVDRSPGEVFATLLDEGKYLCSERTMYRILALDQPVRERRNQLQHPQYAKPELVATEPNQIWSWDITKLLGPKKWTYYYLYLLLDIFSRSVVGWMVADRENSALAGRLIQETCHKQGVQPQVLTLTRARLLLGRFWSTSGRSAAWCIRRRRHRLSTCWSVWLKGTARRTAGTPSKRRSLEGSQRHPRQSGSSRSAGSSNWWTTARTPIGGPSTETN